MFGKPNQTLTTLVCIDFEWELSSHQHLQIQQLSGEVAAESS